jgi:hypothetical protein
MALFLAGYLLDFAVSLFVKVNHQYFEDSLKIKTNFSDVLVDCCFGPWLVNLH